MGSPDEARHGGSDAVPMAVASPPRPGPAVPDTHLTLPAPDAVLAALGTPKAGLAPAEAALRLRRDGPNLLPEGQRRSLVRQFLDQLTHFFALMLWTAAALALVGGMPALAIAIVVVIVVNGAFSFIQEYRAEQATRALAALLPQTAVVLRGERNVTVPVADIVAGDLLLLREGDRIAADARVIRSDGIHVDNSTMTGESEPVERSAAGLTAAPADIVDAGNIVLGGTYVASGAATAAVIATGARTRLGGIARITEDVHRRPSPLRTELNRAVRLLAAFAVGAGAVFFGVSVAAGMPAHDGFLFSVGVIVALVPEGLLPTLTLALAMGASRMAQRKALVRHLEAVETIGATTVICTDKTGTLTENQMTASALAIAGVRFSVSGSGYDPAGAVLVGERPVRDEEARLLAPLARVAALCGNARVSEHDGRYALRGRSDRGRARRPRAQGRRRARGRGAHRPAPPRAALRLDEAPHEHGARDTRRHV